MTGAWINSSTTDWLRFNQGKYEQHEKARTGGEAAVPQIQTNATRSQRLWLVCRTYSAKRVNPNLCHNQVQIILNTPADHFLPFSMLRFKQTLTLTFHNKLSKANTVGFLEHSGEPRIHLLHTVTFFPYTESTCFHWVNSTNLLLNKCQTHLWLFTYPSHSPCWLFADERVQFE